MKVHHVLICFFFFSLQAGNFGVLAGPRILTGTEGGSITVACSFMLAGDRRFFCKQECEEGVLIETTDDRDENGRYKVEYSRTFYLSYPVLYVTITRLSKSDAGRYMCGLGKPSFPDSQEDFELIVKDSGFPRKDVVSKPNHTSRPFSTSASTIMMTPSLSFNSGSLTSSSASPEITEQTERGTAPLGSVPTTSKPNWTLQTFPTSASTPTTTQHLSSSSVSFTSSSASPETTEPSEQQHTERATARLGSAPTTSKPNWTLQTFPTSASTPTMTQHLSSSSVSFTSSSASPETTEPSEQQQTERATVPLGSTPTTSKPNWTLQTFPTSASTPTMTQHLSSSSVSFTSSSASPETTEPSEQQRTERATARLDSWNLLYVGFALLIMMAVFLVFGLLFRATRRKKYVIRAEYTQGRYIEQNGDNYSATAAGSQNQATEDSAALLHSAPTGNSSDVNYSEVSSDANNMETSLPL